jgi:hypothetical protein
MRVKLLIMLLLVPGGLLLVPVVAGLALYNLVRRRQRPTETVEVDWRPWATRVPAAREWPRA